VAIPSNKSWWQANSSTYHQAWPQTDPNPSNPIIGWALDGFPIRGPYNSSGHLLRGSSHPESSLDSCNGGFDQGEYSYYITATPPFSPPCLMGANLGKITSDVVQKVCPYAGRNNTIVYSEVGLAASLAANDEALFGGSCDALYTGPFFLFRINPPLTGQRWQSFSIVFAIIWSLVVATTGLSVMKHYQHAMGSTPVWIRCVQGFLFLSSFSRIIFFVTDPFYIHKRPMSAEMTGILYGVIFPCMSASILCTLFHMHEIILTMSAIRMTIVDRAKKIQAFLPRFRWIYAGFVIGSSPVQFVAH
jgi:hypothetical protein